MFRILVAHRDDLLALQLSCAFSSVPGLEVEAMAFDGGAALDLALSAKPDVVFLDLELPPMGGLALITTIKRDAPGTRVIVISRHSGVVQWARVAGADGVLAPSDSECLPNNLRWLTPRGSEDPESPTPQSPFSTTGGRAPDKARASWSGNA